MKSKEKLLAANLLEEVSNIYADNGCNDWSYPTNWTEEEKYQFAQDYHSWNGDLEDFEKDKRTNLPDFAVMRFLAYKLEQEASEEMQEFNY